MPSKVIWGFLVGFLASVFVMAGIIFYFLRPTGSNVQLAPPLKHPSSRVITLTGRVLVPPQLQEFTTRPGFQIFRIMGVNSQLGAPLASYEISRTGFRDSFSVDVNFDYHFIDPIPPFPADKYVFLSVQMLYCFGDINLNLPINQICASFDGHVLNATVPLEIPVEEITAGNTFDIGTLAFVSRNSHGPDQACLDKDTFLSGVVMPTSTFLERMPKKKKAVLGLVPFPDATTDTEPKVPFFFKEIEIKPKGAPFSAPMPEKLARRTAQAYVRLCDVGTPNEKCWPEIVAGQYFATNEPKLQFRLREDGFRRIFCGERGRTLYLHWFESKIGPTNARIANKKNPSLPPEIIEPGY